MRTFDKFKWRPVLDGCSLLSGLGSDGCLLTSMPRTATNDNMAFSSPHVTSNKYNEGIDGNTFFYYLILMLKVLSMYWNWMHSDDRMNDVKIGSGEFFR